MSEPEVEVEQNSSDDEKAINNKQTEKPSPSTKLNGIGNDVTQLQTEKDQSEKKESCSPTSKSENELIVSSPTRDFTVKVVDETNSRPVDDSVSSRLRENPVIVVFDSETPQSTVTSYSQVYDTVSSVYNTVDSQTNLICPGKENSGVKKRSNSRVSWSSYDNPAAEGCETKVKLRKHDGRHQDVVPAPPKKQFHLCQPKQYGLKLFLAVLLCIIVGGVTVIWVVYEKQLYQSEIDRLIFYEPIDRKFRIINGSHFELLYGELGKNIPRKFVPRYCANGDLKHFCVDYNGFGKLTIDYDKKSTYPNDVACHDIKWQGASTQSSLTDCFKLSNANWYGGPLILRKSWPIQNDNHTTNAYVTGDIYRGVYGPVAERYLLSSFGVAVLVKRSSPLFIAMNNKTKEICITANFIDPPYTAINRKPSLSYKICKAQNIRNVHEFMISNFIPKPYKSPVEEFFKYPRWSTWGIHGLNTTQDDVVALAKRLNDLSFPGKNIVIPDGWEEEHGDIKFNKKKFPNPKIMVEDLKKLGYNMELWVFPIVSTASVYFAEGMNNDYFVKTLADNVPGLIRWYHGFGASIDTVNPSAVQWFITRLESFQKTYGNAFHFGGGEVDNLPHEPVFHRPVTTPNIYSSNYARIASLFGPYAQVEVGSNTQNLSSIIHLGNAFPIWGDLNGLKSIIPNVLTLSLHGYPFFVLPVGTSGAFENEAAKLYNITIPEKPSKELYIRWLQIGTFLPAFQISTMPWEYDGETVHIAHKMIKLHKEVVVPIVMDIVRNINETGLPIVRPLWWIAPFDTYAQTINDQFLLGDKIIVAPMVGPGNTREVYLPRGIWDDIYGATYKVIKGSFLSNYAVPLDRVPYFKYAGDIKN